MNHPFGRIDYNKAKIAAYVVVAFFLALVFVYGVRTMGGPELREGDKVESLACPVCAGSGEGKEAGKRCATCLGAKKLKAIVPGPNHPALVKGTVRDLSAFESQAEADSTAQRDAQERKLSLQAVRGAVPAATLSFEGPETLQLQAKSTGKFSGYLVPGDYRLEVVAPGYAPLRREINVPAREQPIWPDSAQLEEVPLEHLQLDLFLNKP